MILYVQVEYNIKDTISLTQCHRGNNACAGGGRAAITLKAVIHGDHARYSGKYTYEYKQSARQQEE